MRDVVITGVGAVTPVGGTAQATWEAITRGESGAGPVTGFDMATLDREFRSQIACEVDRDTTAHPCVNERNMARHSQFGVVAAAEALADAGFGQDPEWDDPSRVGVSIGNCLGESGDMGSAAVALRNDGSVSTRLSVRYLPNMPSGYVSITFDAQGPNRAPATACAAGTHAIARGVDDIRLERADVMIVGGSETGVRPVPFAGFDVIRALSTRNDQPATASRPFDESRDGFVMAEGGGILILEAADHAEQRGASTYARVAGVGQSGDAEHPTRPPSDARGLSSAVTRALEDADIERSAVDHVNTHGTSTPRGDDHEMTCLRSVFETVPPVTSVKGSLGHTLGAAGAIEAVIAALSIHEETIPPTVNHETTGDSFPVVAETRSQPVETVVSNSAGFGGTNGTVVLTADD